MLLVQIFVFGIATARRIASLADVSWAVLFAVAVGHASLAASSAEILNPAKLTLAAGVWLWAAQLAGYIAWKNIGKPEDRRYAAWRAAWGRHFFWRSFLQIFMLQGLLAVVIALPVLAALAAPAPVAQSSLFLIFGGGIFLIGLTLECTANWQLAAWQRDPANRGQILTTGLRRYSRHPQYFGEMLVWWGLLLASLGLGAPVWTAVGPAVLTFLLLRVSGVAMLERNQSTKPGYAEYAARTSRVIPWPPRRIDKIRRDDFKA